MRTVSLLAFAMLALLPRIAGAQNPRIDAPAAAPANAPAAAPAKSVALPPLEELRATRERPLFSSRRKPDDEVAESETPVAQESPESLPFDLTGVVMGADVAIAILHNRETQETVHLRQGETVEAWSIGEIAPRHIVLRQDDRELRLELFQTKPEGSSGSPALAMPPPAMRPVARHAPPPPSAQAEVPQPRRNLQNNQSQRRSVRRGQQLRRNQNR